MGAITVLMEELGFENTKAIGSAEKLVGGVTGVLGYVSAAQGALELLGLVEEAKDTLRPRIEYLFSKLTDLIDLAIESDRQGAEIARINRIRDAVAESHTGLDIALNHLRKPELYDIKTAYENSVTAVNSLSDGARSMRVYTPALEFHVWLYGTPDRTTDAAYEDRPALQHVPPPDPGWDYRYRAPALIEVVANHLIVIAILEPDMFLQAHHSILLDAANEIASIHDKARDGLWDIIPPYDEIRRTNYWGGVEYEGNRFFGWWGWRMGTQPRPPHSPDVTLEADPNVLIKPYGTVDPISWIRAFGSYQNYILTGMKTPLTPPHASEAMRRFRTRFRVSTLKKRMQVYRAAGLDALRNSMERLRLLLGEPIPPPDQELRWWSLRTVSRVVLPEGIVKAGPGGEVSVRGMIAALSDGMSMKDRSSLRAVLEFEPGPERPWRTTLENEAKLASPGLV